MSRPDTWDGESASTGAHADVPTTPPSGAATYAAAGVDIEAGDRAVALMREWVAKARRPEMLSGDGGIGDTGGFAGLFDASALRAYKRPMLATSTDGVGTKVAIAQAMDVHNTVGYDLVGMVVDDIAVCGAEPLFLTDYIACGKVVPERIAAIVEGIAGACVVAGCGLIGGETAEHPGLLGADEYDLAGATTGVVEADRVLGPARVREGDVAIALGSSGLHSNGYSLVRMALARAGWSLDEDLDRHVDDLGRTLGEELLEPTRIYAQDCLAITKEAEVHAMAHITGGGLAANLARVVPPGLEVVIDRSTWRPQPVFDLIARLGGVERAELERTLNVGVGMIVLAPVDQVDRVLHTLRARQVTAWVAGETRASADPAGGARLVGAHD